MKKIILPIFLIICTINVNAQIFWTENFESGSTGGLVVSSYTGPNGTWTLTAGTEKSAHNVWYVSCAENGHTNGICGTGCVPVTPTATGATLHVGSNASVFGDLGAQYDAGGTCGIFSSSSFSSSSSFFGVCVETDERAESPTINCTGRTGITISFNYIEDGQGTVDDATVWYYDGTSWSLLVNTPKTAPICPPVGGVTQGYWTSYSYALPASANNNPKVKIGFRWVNNDDGVGTDPSFAVDSVSLSGAKIPPPPPVASFTLTPSATICQDSTIIFTSTSTSSVAIDSIRWVIPGMVVSTPTSSPLTQTFLLPGVDTVHLYVYSGGVGDTATTIVTVKGTPHPVITKVGHKLSVPSVYTVYQWGKEASGTFAPITGATNSTYTYTVSGTYGVVVDSSDGCYGFDTFNTGTTGVANINTLDNKYWVVQGSNSMITLHATEPLEEALTINIYDASGREILNGTWAQGADTKELNEIAPPPGMYIIKLSNQNTSSVLQWMKQ